MTPGDGFTAAEIDAALHPTLAQTWQPSPTTKYDDLEISEIAPGPRCITFMGRIANVFDIANAARMPRTAKGCLRIVIKDDSGAVTVRRHMTSSLYFRLTEHDIQARLWYSKVEYKLRLGQLVTVWATHVSADTRSGLTTALTVSLFPEADHSCYLKCDDDDGTLCKIPLGCVDDGCPTNLMTFENFINCGHEVLDAKVLMLVKSIGARKKGGFADHLLALVQG